MTTSILASQSDVGARSIRVAKRVCAIVLICLFGFPVADAVTGSVLNEAQIPPLQSAALNGDGRAAMQLADHYGLTEKEAEGKYWFRIAVEDGDEEATQSYAARLWMSGGMRNCTRALHLYENVLANKSSKLSSQVSKEIRTQRDQMKTEFDKCATRSCSRMVEGAWCE